MNDSLRNNEIEEIEIDSGYFDLRIIIRNIFLNKKLISIITFISMAISLFYSFSKEKIYKGSFQIVLKNENNNPLQDGFLNNAFALRTSALFKIQRNKDINTQVEILRSPSVLMPIFEYVKSEKLKAKKDLSKYRFDKWLKKSLFIELLENTTVLTIEYYDNDKELILNALDKISNTYQNYSEKERITGLENGIKYLENQIEIYKQKSQNSFSDFQRFATDNNMNAFFLSEGDSNKNLSSLIDLQSGIINDSDLRKKIKTLDFYIKNIESKEDKDLNFVLARNIALSINNKTMLNNLKELDIIYSKLLEAKNNFTENDLYLIDLESKFDFMKSEFVNNFLVELKALKSINELNLQSNSKPDSKYIKYKELARKSIRDDLTLQNLEQQKQILSLEQAKSSKPWELITEPTLFDKPLGLAKRIILFNGLLVGLFISIIIIYLKIRIKDYVYTKKELIKDINLGFQLNLQSTKPDQLKDTIKILSLKLSQREKLSNVGLFVVGDIPKEDINSLVNNLTLENKMEIIISKDILEIEKLKNKLILLSPGTITRNELKTLKQNINFQGISFIGALIIESEPITFSEIFLKKN